MKTLPVELLDIIFLFANNLDLIVPFRRYMSNNTIHNILQKNKLLFSLDTHSSLLELINELGIDWKPVDGLALARAFGFFSSDRRLALPLVALGMNGVHMVLLSEPSPLHTRLITL